MIQIVTKSAKPEEPLALLTECHRRIEMFLNRMQRIAMEGGSLTGDRKNAFASSITFFEQMLPKHASDEEESLFPRMRECRTPELEHVLPALEALESDHQKAETLHAQVERLAARWLADEVLDATEMELLRTALNDLASLYEAHIAVEEEKVFPLAVKILPREEQEEVRREMARRRAI
jgi:hemerythrin-like domain-containing protein